MPAVPFYHVAAGHRTIVAMTCALCGRLRSGDQFGRNRRGGLIAYLDRRCRECRWARMESNPGR